MEEEMCLVDSCTTNFILRERKYFQTLTQRTRNILIITGRDMNIVDSGKATIILHMGTQVTIENALLYPDFTHTLLSYRYICKNVLHVITHEENNEEFFHIIKKNGYGHDILERILSLPSGLYYIYIKPVPLIAYKVIFQNVDAFMTLHERLGHLRIGLVRKILGNSTDHNLNTTKF
jgi:hypothetical protein